MLPPTTVLFSDEPWLMRESVVDSHSVHMPWSENHYSTVSPKVQHRFGNSIFAGSPADQLLGPYLLYERLNGANCLIFLQYVLPDLMQGKPPLCARACRECMMVHSTFWDLVPNHRNVHIPGDGGLVAM